MTVLKEVLAGLIKVVVESLDDSKHDNEEQIYYYSSDDFMGQDYRLNDSKDTYSGQFHVVLRHENGKDAGHLSWDSSARKPEVADDEWSLLEQVNMCLGTTHNAPAWLGAALSKAPNGYYKEDRPYKFYVNGSKGKKHVTITKTGPKERQVTVGSCEPRCREV